MGSGKNEGFPPAMKAWLEQQQSAYLAKTAFGKPVVPGEPEPCDDDDLKKFVDGLLTAFKVNFSIELQTGELSDATVLSTRFHTWFRNRKAAAKRELLSTTATKILRTSGARASTSTLATQDNIPAMPLNMKHLWTNLLKGTAITGRSVFEDAHRATVSAEVSETRRRENIGSREHVGMLNSKLKTMWEGLGDGKAEWDDKAEALRTSDDEELIYQNQAHLTLSINQLFSALIGPTTEGNHRIGHAQFHVLYAYRDGQEEICTGAIDVLGSKISNQIPFQANHGDYLEHVMKPWTTFAQRDLPFNRARVKTVFVYDLDGVPILPSISDTITPDALRKLLTDYIQAQWSYFKSGDVPVPWDDRQFPNYINPLVESLPNPSTAKPRGLFQLHDDISSHQEDEATGFRLFTLPAQPTIPTTSTTPSDTETVPSTTRAPPSAASASTPPSALTTAVTLSLMSMAMTSLSSAVTETPLPLAPTTVTPSLVSEASECLVPAATGTPTTAAASTMSQPSLSTATIPSLAPTTVSKPSEPMTSAPSAPTPVLAPTSAAVPPPSTPVTVPPASQSPPVNSNGSDVIATAADGSVPAPPKRPISDVESIGKADKPTKKRRKAVPVSEKVRQSARTAAKASSNVELAKAPEEPAKMSNEPPVNEGSLSSAPTSPVFFDRNGKPRKKSKHWRYEIA